ncbi:MAG TPA: hypothetical protein VIF64_08105 [Pyrinomonadaceae bacterium]|jgi:hypothetical protein
MNNEGAQAILIAFVLIALLLAVSIPFVLFIGYFVLQKRKRDRTREVIRRDHQQLIGNHQAFPVRYASELRFKSLFKIFPWESAGILVTVPGSALLLGQTLSGSPVTLQFAPGNSTVNWLGKAPWPNGAVSWFYFTTTAEKHYISSETGLFVLGSAKSTKAIYHEVSKNFLAHSAARD